jgi:hypothetical protein
MRTATTSLSAAPLVLISLRGPFRFVVRPKLLTRV